MTYIKHMRIKPVRSKTNFLMWQLSYWKNSSGFWFEWKHELRYLTKQAFDDAQKVVNGRDTRIVSS